MSRACAFVPGHVTGFFEIHDEVEDLRQRGSRGAGICLSKGAFSTVEISESETQNIEVQINQTIVEAPVTVHALKKIIGNRHFEIKVSSELELPVGQGFGMSGAGTLASALATAQALDLDLSKDQIVCAAHEAEIICATGLGDVMPQSLGGVVIRKKEGCHPFGIIEKIETEEMEIVLCVIGKELSTREIITDPHYKRKINKHGNECLAQLIKIPKLVEMMWLSLSFSNSTGLLSREVEYAVTEARRFGLVSMSMLGNSIFALGDTKGLVDALESYGEVHICTIDSDGARIVEDRK